MSTYIGMAQTVPESEQFMTKAIHHKGVKGLVRVEKLRNSASNVLDEFEPTVAFIEGYGLGNQFTMKEMVEVGTVVRLELLRRGIPWYEIPPTTLKKWLTGSGKAKKPDMKAAVLSRFGFTSKSDDVIDGVALNRMGAAFLSGSLTDEQKKSVVRGY